MSHSYQLYVFASVSVIVVLITGCGSGVQHNQTSILLITDTANIFTTPPPSSPTTTSTLTLTPILVLTQKPTITSTAELKKTSTPLPTLSPTEAGLLLVDLLQNNAGCELPCWWGVIPGETLLLDAQQKFQQMISISDFNVFGSTDGTVAMNYQLEERITLHVVVSYQVYDRQETIGRVFVQTTALRKIEEGYEVVVGHPEFNRLLEPYLIRQLLTSHGEPDEIWLQGWPFNDDRVPHYALLILYASQGIMARYEGDASTPTPYMRICPDESGPQLTLWDPKREDQGKIVKELIAHENIVWAAPKFRPIQEVTDLDAKTFYQTMQTPGACFETPIELWE